MNATYFARRLLLATAAMALACGEPNEPGANAGSVRVRTTTTGADLDPDGYAVSYCEIGRNGGCPIRAIGPNETVLYTGLEPGDYTFVLDGVARNCAVEGDNPRFVVVTLGESTAVAFEVNCVVPVATMTVTPTVDTIGVGATSQFIATPRDSMGNPLIGRAVAWSILNPTVATVSPSGVVMGLAPGITIVAALIDWVSGTAQLVVTGTPVNVAGEWRIAEQFFVWDEQAIKYPVCEDSASFVLSQDGSSIAGVRQASGSCASRPSGPIDSGTVSGRVLSLTAAGCHYALQVIGDPPRQVTGGAWCDDGDEGADVSGARVGASTSGAILQARPLTVAERGRLPTIARRRRRS